MTYLIPLPLLCPHPPSKEVTLPPGPDQAQRTFIIDLEAIDNSHIKKRTG
jgi:hypothetical protein